MYRIRWFTLWQNRIWIICPVRNVNKWYNYCKDKDSKKELSPESHDEAYTKAYTRYKDDPQLGTLTNIEIAKAGGATEKMVAYIREKELMTNELS